MIKTKFIYSFIISCLLMMNVASCSDKGNTIVASTQYIFEGIYDGDKLDITLDDLPLQNVTAEVTMEDGDIVTIQLTNFLGSTITWYIEYTLSEQWSGVYTHSNGRNIRYTVDFPNLFSDDRSCQIVCKTLN